MTKYPNTTNRDTEIKTAVMTTALNKKDTKEEDVTMNVTMAETNMKKTKEQI